MYTFGMTGIKWTIFQNAVDLFAKRGFHAVPMRDLARSAQIFPASIYNCFSSKEDILKTIYTYFNYYSSVLMPSLDYLLEQTELSPPKEVLSQLIRSLNYSKINPIMDKILIIAINEMPQDPQAEALVMKRIFEQPKELFLPIFEKLVQQKKIRPFDLEAYLFIHSSLCLSMAILNRSSRPLQWEAWRQCYDALLNAMIFETNPSVPVK